MEVVDLRKEFHGVVAVEGIRFAVPRPQMLGVIGALGAGGASD